MKVDPKVGATMPEFGKLTDQPGIETGTRGGYKGARIVRKTDPYNLPPLANTRRVRKAPLSKPVNPYRKRPI